MEIKCTFKEPVLGWDNPNRVIYKSDSYLSLADFIKAVISNEEVWRREPPYLLAYGDDGN